MRGPATVIAAILLLAGCESTSVRDDGATGELGRPDQGSPADIYIDLSAAYLREGQFNEAYKNALKAVASDDQSSNAHYVLALVQQRLGQLESADAAYRKAISVDPRNPVALNAYGTFLCEQQRYDEADSYFRRALANPLYSTPWLALHNAGHCQEQAGQVNAAEIDYREALQRNPGYAPSLKSMARLSFAEGSYLSARAYLQRYAEVAPHNAETLWLGIRTERQLGDSRQVARYAGQLRRAFPDSHEAKLLRDSSDL